MNKVLIGAAVAAAMFGISERVQAAPIAAGSELSLNGSDTFTATATTFDITFSNPANIGGTSGSFADAAAFGPVPPAIDNVVTMISTLTDASTNFQLYSATVGAITSTLTAGAISSFTFTAGSIPSLDVFGTGTLTLTGFDSEPGNFTLTTQGGQTNVTFSETSIASGAVSEPGALGIIGIGLLAVFGLRRWRSHDGVAAA